MGSLIARRHALQRRSSKRPSVPSPARATASPARPRPQHQRQDRDQTCRQDQRRAGLATEPAIRLTRRQDTARPRPQPRRRRAGSSTAERVFVGGLSPANNRAGGDELRSGERRRRSPASTLTRRNPHGATHAQANNHRRPPAALAHAAHRRLQILARRSGLLHRDDRGGRASVVLWADWSRTAGFNFDTLPAGVAASAMVFRGGRTARAPQGAAKLFVVYLREHSTITAEHGRRTARHSRSLIER